MYYSIFQLHHHHQHYSSNVAGGGGHLVQRQRSRTSSEGGGGGSGGSQGGTPIRETEGGASNGGGVSPNHHLLRQGTAEAVIASSSPATAGDADGGSSCPGTGEWPWPSMRYEGELDRKFRVQCSACAITRKPVVDVHRPMRRWQQSLVTQISLPAMSDAVSLKFLRNRSLWGISPEVISFLRSFVQAL